MSQRNGDRSRTHRLRKAKIARRARRSALKKTAEAKNTPASTKSAAERL